MTDEKKDLVPVQTGQVNELFRMAIDKGLSVEGLEKLVTLHERVADRAAAQEFADALARFQRECPSIPQDAEAKIATKSGASYKYTYSKLPTIANTIREPLARENLSYSWDSKVENAIASANCILLHVNGHKRISTFSCPTETQSGMSPQQAVASAVTFCKRQSLVLVLGLTTTDADTDCGDPEPLETISEKQVADLEALADEVGADMGKFAAYIEKICGAKSLSEIPAGQFRRLVSDLERKRK